MDTTSEHQSAPTGAQNPASEEQADRPLGDAACCASSFAEMLVLAESIKPPFMLRVSEGNSATGRWFTAITDAVEVAAVAPEIIIHRFGCVCGKTLAAVLRGDPSHTPELLTPLARRLIHTIRKQDQMTQQQVLDILEKYETGTQPVYSLES